jgi:hypothetical protein
MDLRGLAALFGKINALLSEPAGAANEIESLDLFGLSRFLQRRGEVDLAHSACAQALEIGLPAEFRPKARRELALMAKRRGEHARAAEIWLEIVGDPHDGIHACEQLAIYYERHTKDPVKAAQFANLAVATLRRQRANSHNPFLTARFARLEKKFLQRVARLEKKSPLSSPARPRGAFHGHALVSQTIEEHAAIGGIKRKKVWAAEQIGALGVFLLKRFRILPEEARRVFFAVQAQPGNQDELLRLFVLEDGVAVAIPGRCQSLCAIVVKELL